MKKYRQIGIPIFLLGGFQMYTLLWHMDIYVRMGTIATACSIIIAFVLLLMGLMFTLRSFDNSL